MALMVLIFLLISALPAWLAIDGLNTGVVRMQSGSYSRADEPAWFWSVIAMYGGVVAWCLYLAGDVALGV